MTSGRPHRRWPLHLALLVGLAICVLGVTVEWRRAHQGHLSAWVYVVEWPVFAIVGAVIWWRLLHEDPSRPKQSRTAPPAPLTDPEDPDLQAWNQYVDRFTSADSDDDAGPPSG